MKKALLLFKDVQKTVFMQATGVFEPFKVVAFEAEATVVDDYGMSNVAASVRLNSRDFHLIGVVTEGFCWFDSAVKAISDGEKWITLADRFGDLYTEYCKREAVDCGVLRV